MYQHRFINHRSVITSLAVLGLIACDGLTSPSEGDTDIGFSVATSEAIGATANRASYATAADGALIIASGNDTLRIDSVRVVLAQVSLARKANEACGTAGHDDAHDETCSPLNSGPFIVKLPLTAGALSLFDVPVPKGAYTGFMVRVHKPNHLDSGPNVQAFLTAHPEWENKSIMVDGTFNGVVVHWSHDPVAQLAVRFDPPLVIESATGSNFTLKINIASWFRMPTGALIDPNAKTNVNYPQIALNIKNSFRVFRDDKRKGHDDGTP